MTTIFKAPPIQLSEFSGDSITKKMQILKVGEFFHEKYGKFQITKKMLSEMVENFKKGVRGVRPALDYSHNSEDVAAGWFRDLYLENDSELWADIEMTPKGTKVLSDKEFGYTSAEFDPAYETNETPTKKVGAVLLGAGLTNRPVIKNMKPVIELSEGGKMDIKELEEKCLGYEKQLAEKEELMKKLMEDAGAESLEQIMEMIQKVKGENPELMEKKAELEKSLAEKEELTKQLSEKSEALKLAEEEKNKAIKEVEFTVLLSEGKACVAQKEAFLKGDMMEFAKNSQAMNLSEKGHGKGIPKDVDAENEILKLAKEKVAGEGIQFSEAVSKVRKENPELVKKLQEKK
jgi:phage I-like protein